MSQDTAIKATTVRGLVSDAPPVLLATAVEPLSLTNDGRLRVSVEPSRAAVAFFSPDEERMWGDHEPSYTFSGSPWESW